MWDTFNIAASGLRCMDLGISQRVGKSLPVGAHPNPNPKIPLQPKCPCPNSRPQRGLRTRDLASVTLELRRRPQAVALRDGLTDGSCGPKTRAFPFERICKQCLWFMEVPKWKFVNSGRKMIEYGDAVEARKLEHDSPHLKVHPRRKNQKNALDCCD